jgi:eukaryotic-like serine/threonine-protein kinase
MDGADLRPGRRFGRFSLEERLGEGAAGIVFRADGDLALKIIRPERAGHGDALARFLREARAAKTVEDRHLVPILEAGEVEGLAYLAMPYMAGGSLAERLRERGRLGLDETVDLAAQLGRGLDALHAAGILHRDVKPSNVLLAADGTAALSDFGLARAGDWTRLTREGQLLGTALYLAPEVIEGREATAAADVYALGCVLYECVAGRPPFEGRDAAEVGFAHLTETPRDPGELGEALLAALDKDPAARPTTGSALARMLHVARSARPA